MLIKNGFVITMDPERRVITDGAVVLEGDRVLAVGKTDEIQREFDSEEVFDASRMIVMPGIVNAHSHLFAMYSRGIGADGQRSKRQKETPFSWDIERLSHFNRERCRISAMLASTEMIRSGITTTQDSHYINLHRDAFDGVCQAVVDSGIRAVIGRGCWDAIGLAPEEHTEDVETAVRESERVISNWHGEGEGRVSIRVEASMLAQCTDEMILATKEVSKSHGIGWASHVQYRLGTSRTDPRKGDASLRRYSGRSVEYLESLDVLGPDSLLIHCTHADNREIAILARTGTPVATCPVANAWAGNPVVAPVPEMLNKGVTVGLGTDSVATNDSLDLFQAMKFCALIHKVNSGDTQAMTAEKVLEMSTINSAKALQLDSDVGSLEPGKKADVIVLDMDSPGLTPSISPVKNLVYGAGSGGTVDTVIIDGRIVMGGKTIKTFDERELYKGAEEEARAILRSIGRLGPNDHFLHSPPWRYL